MYWSIWLIMHFSQNERTTFKIEIHIVSNGPTQGLVKPPGETSLTGLVWYIFRDSHNRLPGATISSCRATKNWPWFPDRATKSFAIFLYIYVVGQPKLLVGQPHIVFKTNVKPYIYNRNTTRRCRTKKCIARSLSNLVNSPFGFVHQFDQAECNTLLRSAPECCIPFITCRFSCNWKLLTTLTTPLTTPLKTLISTLFSTPVKTLLEVAIDAAIEKAIQDAVENADDHDMPRCCWWFWECGWLH